ncbi:hypothetical protein WJX74_003182 [Apatococcus lobatus]|uniref:Uncharacterized protein n=1 Tax=Apatococcus lobatus TaxID=904363 RepID=A0AAW1S391_9CHLO
MEDQPPAKRQAGLGSGYSRASGGTVVLPGSPLPERAPQENSRDKVSSQAQELGLVTSNNRELHLAMPFEDQQIYPPEANPAPALVMGTPAEADSGAGTYNQPFVRDQTAQAELMERLSVFRKRVKSLAAANKAKPDMVVNKQMKHLLPPRSHGHVPGTAPGDVFYGKGELAITGVHSNISGGIDCLGSMPAYAIVLSGGYKDDDDFGKNFQYSGMGGRDADGNLYKDQEWTRGNLCLRANAESKAPVRVIRAKLDPETKKPVHTYDGLWRVKKAEHVAGIDKYLVCRFEMEAVEGHSTVSAAVTYRCLKGTLQKKRLASDNAADDKPVPKKRKVPTNAKRQGMLMADISGGLEPHPIPVINDRDSTGPPQITYTRHSQFGSKEAVSIHAAALEAFTTRQSCGRKMSKALGLDAPFYNGAGCLRHIEYSGIYECGESCKAKACKVNRVVSNGINLPLEVFNTGAKRGWGLRCQSDIRLGAFICEYAGVILTDAVAGKLQQQGQDAFLFNMDHFLLCHKKISPEDPPEDRLKLPPLPFKTPAGASSSITVDIPVAIPEAVPEQAAEPAISLKASAAAPQPQQDANPSAHVEAGAAICCDLETSASDTVPSEGVDTEGLKSKPEACIKPSAAEQTRPAGSGVLDVATSDALRLSACPKPAWKLQPSLTSPLHRQDSVRLETAKAEASHASAASLDRPALLPAEVADQAHHIGLPLSLQQDHLPPAQSRRGSPEPSSASMETESNIKIRIGMDVDSPQLAICNSGTAAPAATPGMDRSSCDGCHIHKDGPATSSMDIDLGQPAAGSAAAADAHSHERYEASKSPGSADALAADSNGRQTEMSLAAVDGSAVAAAAADTSGSAGSPDGSNALAADASPHKDEGFLVVDARTTGNVGRFLNHKCEPNCSLAIVQTPGEGTACSSSMCYRIGIFAHTYIPAMQELTYDYGYEVQGRGMTCHCGTKGCRKSLL